MPARCLSPAICLKLFPKFHFTLNNYFTHANFSLSPLYFQRLHSILCLCSHQCSHHKEPPLHRFNAPTVPTTPTPRALPTRLANMSTTDAKPASEAPVETPAETPAETAAETPTEVPAESTQESSVADAQVDGSGPPGNGSAFAESEFKVEVKLADRQKDPNDPLFSAKSFEELKLYVATA